MLLKKTICIAASGLTLVLIGGGDASAGGILRDVRPTAQLANGPANNIWVNLAKKVVPSVVNISTITSPTTISGEDGNSEDMVKRFLNEFFGRSHGRGYQENKAERDLTAPPGNEMMPKAVALGSGFIIDKDGTILTNNHVVQNADEIKIGFTEGSDDIPVAAKVIGRDPDLDIALVRIKDPQHRKFVPIPLGDSDQVDVGEYVMAIGNPFGQGHSVTHGIISQKGRSAPDFPLATYLQTDVAINPGNSGGPLVDLNGNVIAINNAIEARAQGIGFAIPINLIKQVLPQLKAHGTVARGYIGVVVGELTPPVSKKLGAAIDLHAPFVTQVYPESPAARAGLKNYDVILDFNGKTLRTGSDLIAEVTASKAGNTIPLKVIRGGVEKMLSLKVGQRPANDDELAKYQRKPASVRRHKDDGGRIETGMTLQTVTPMLARELGMSEKITGVVVDTTDPASPADKIGLSTGDVIMEVDQKPISDVRHFYSTVKDKKEYLLRIRKLTGAHDDTFAVVVLDLKS